MCRDLSNWNNEKLCRKMNLIKVTHAASLPYKSINLKKIISLSIKFVFVISEREKQLPTDQIFQ